MAEIPVEHKKAAAFPWWLIPLILLLLLLPLLYYCSRNPTTVVDNTNVNGNRGVILTNVNGNGGVILTTNANGYGNNTSIAFNSNTAVVFNEEDRIREANERARLAMAKFYPNGTPQQVVDALNLSIVNFAKDSSDIPESDKPLLKQAAEMLKKSPANTHLEVDGYTDNDGTPEYNQKLSERRAASVRNELVSYGVPAAMLSTKGFGETNPKASNETPQGRFENRRIEYKVATGNTAVEKVVPGNDNK